jgi:hypothetical protein
MLSGTESRKSGAGRSAATTRFSGFHACARSLTAGGVRPRKFLKQSRPKSRPKLREGQSPEGRDYRLGEAPAEYGPTGEARHARAEVHFEDEELPAKNCPPKLSP